MIPRKGRRESPEEGNAMLVDWACKVSMASSIAEDWEVSARRVKRAQAG
jgi:hypothetical protein